MSEPDTSSKWSFEKALWAAGKDNVAGVDEAGRGPLAGPVTAAAVVLPGAWAESGLPRELEGLNDSKQVSHARRDRYFEFLSQCTEVRKAIVCCSSEIIDQVNILQATHRAMNEALAQLGPPLDHALVDGTTVKSLRWPQTAIVKGDSRSYSIAAASILAKVHRDRMMLAFHDRWPAYGFDIHKGYPTPQHLDALKRHGPCEIHRLSFGPVKQFTPPISSLQQLDFSQNPAGGF